MDAHRIHYHNPLRKYFRLWQNSRMKTYEDKLKEWAKRRERIYRLSVNKTPTQIARLLGITHQRVSQILSKKC